MPDSTQANSRAEALPMLMFPVVILSREQIRVEGLGVESRLSGYRTRHGLVPPFIAAFIFAERDSLMFDDQRSC